MRDFVLLKGITVRERLIASETPELLFFLRVRFDVGIELFPRAAFLSAVHALKQLSLCNRVDAQGGRRSGSPDHAGSVGHVCGYYRMLLAMRLHRLSIGKHFVTQIAFKRFFPSMGSPVRDKR